ncbi:zinc metallochaperone AztD [Cellulosimicrobium sp. 72-3]|uniref:zinc metallochaperone AztD n=1 Tax=Cellulosimicrobium sp. 72-3 TaxID=2731680 RepID=UPI0020A2A760|nr:zinc metallochaperone AztD [Cellulosimicrobium sp. 72-3]
MHHTAPDPTDAAADPARVTAPPGARARRRPLALALGLALPLTLVAACAQGAGSESEQGDAAEPAPSATSDVSEAAALTPRLAITYDGGVQVLDATTLEVVDDLELDGFNRLNPAGDGRHLLVSTSGGFQVLDAGTWAEPHGDHAHYYTADPVLTDVTYAAEKPGHVVVHDGRTALFDDGTGEITVLDSATVADPHGIDDARTLTTPAAHHGVAVELSDGSLVVSEGTEDARTGVRLLDAAGDEVAANDQCPGVHGEAVAAGEAVVIGCEDGVLVVAGGAITKVAAPDAYGRIGNQAGSEASPVVLGDYKSDPDAELERPTRVSLVDTRDASLRLVDLPASYTFRSLGRGDAGEALVLGTDGSLHVIDPESGTVVRSVPVVDAWEEPEEWQEPRPTLFVQDGIAYVTDPAGRAIHAVDYVGGEVWKSAELDVVPNELNGVTGKPATAGGHEADEHAHEDGDRGHDEPAHDEHEGHDHEHEDG